MRFAVPSATRTGTVASHSIVWMLDPKAWCTHHTRARSRIGRVYSHVLRRSVTSQRPAGILGAHDESEERGGSAGASTERLEAFLPAPAEVRAVGSGSKFSAQEYRDKGFTGPIRLFSSAQASAVAAAFFRGTPLTNKQALSQRHQGPQKPPSTHPATWNDTLPMAKNPGLLDLAAEILGPDIVLWATVFWHKLPCSESYIPWQCVAEPSLPLSDAWILSFACHD